MPWEQISFSKKEWKQIDSEIKTFRKRTRFIVDENIPLDLITVLKEKGYDAKSIDDFGLRGRDDKEVYNIACKENRVLITQDKDFLNDSLFPMHNCPGVAVFPAYYESPNAFVTAFGHLLMVHGKSGELWNKQKIIFPGDETVSIRYINSNTGGIGVIRFKFPKNGIPMVWNDE